MTSRSRGGGQGFCDDKSLNNKSGDKRGVWVKNCPNLRDVIYKRPLKISTESIVRCVSYCNVCYVCYVSLPVSVNSFKYLSLLFGIININDTVKVLLMLARFIPEGLFWSGLFKEH